MESSKLGLEKEEWSMDPTRNCVLAYVPVCMSISVKKKKTLEKLPQQKEIVNLGCVII